MGELSAYGASEKEKLKLGWRIVDRSITRGGKLSLMEGKEFGHHLIGAPLLGGKRPKRSRAGGVRKGKD